MTFGWGERPTSRGGSVTGMSAVLQYWCAGLSDDLSVRAVAMNLTPVAHATPTGILYRQGVDIDPQSADLYYITANYGPTNQTVGSYDISFDTTGGTVHITTSKQTVSSKVVGGGAVPNHKQAIGVSSNGVDGTDIIIPALKMQVSFRHPQGQINIDQIKSLARSTGVVNSGPFFGFAAGEVLFLGASGRAGSQSETEVSYSFACSENAAGLTFGDIPAIDKRGHDCLWISFTENVDAAAPVRTPEAAYVERVYRYADLRSILGFG